MFFLTTSIFMSACNTVEEEVSDKEYAIQMLNNRDFDQASIVLKRLHAENPEDHEITLLLASSYSGSVGLNIIDAFGAFSSLIFSGKRDSTIFSGSSGVSPEVEKSSIGDAEVNKKRAKTMVAYFEKLSDGFTVFFGVPYTKPEYRNRFVEAIVLTSQVPEDSEYYLMAKNFSTLLNIVQAMNFTKDAFPEVTTRENWTSLELVCAFRPDLFSRSFVNAFQYISAGIQDARIAANPLCQETCRIEIQNIIHS